MDSHKNLYLQFTILILLLFVFSCNSTDAPKDKEIVSNPSEMNKRAGELIKETLQRAMQNNGKVDDSTKLLLTSIVDKFYAGNEYEPVWSKKEKWEPLADSLFQFISNAKLNGLFPADYHFKNLSAVKKILDTDSLKRMDAVLWGRADILLTDGFMHICRDLKQGRLKPDSLTLSKDSVLEDNFFSTNLKELLEKKEFTSLLQSLEPKHKGYWELKKGIKSFLDSMDNKTYTYVTYPYKRKYKGFCFYIKTLQKRLNESGCIDFINRMPDSAQLTGAIMRYQKQKGLKADGKMSATLARVLNTSDAERFKRIAITLDRYKQLPEKMPKKYIWVNLPGYYLWVIESDTVALESKIICGKPDTRTPLLNSEITDMVTYPTWTVPTSIIAKSYLPKLKNNPSYLSRIGLRLVNGKGETVDPYGINWAKYSRGIPFKVMQGSGDNNALGVMKFNFNNPYSVYLHDTNQRYLFKNSSRALSHGCVRVQQWDKLAYFIARNDSINSKRGDSLRYTADSIRNWIARKVNRRIDVKNHIPLFIQYFSCEGKDGKIRFYEDIYGEDKVVREKYFADK